jgi:hypothetical protein
LIPLDEVFTGKPEIGRWDRRRDFYQLVLMMGDPAQRDALEPVIVERISDRAARRLTPIARVKVKP